MNNSTPSGLGTNTLFRSPLQKSIPAFATKSLGAPQDQTFNPTPVDVNTVNPMFRGIYQQFNDSLNDLQRSEQFSRQNANLGRDSIVQNYDRGVASTEAQRISSMDQARRNNQDFQTQNRVRARAIGGAPSSAFLDLSNKIDQQTQRDFSGINTQAADSIRGFEMGAMEALNKIEMDLNKTIMEIESNRRLSLRERDAQVRSAEENAARAAIGLMQNSESGMGGGEGSVMGESTYNPYAETTGYQLPNVNQPQYNWGMGLTNPRGATADYARQATMAQGGTKTNEILTKGINKGAEYNERVRGAVTGGAYGGLRR